MMYVSDKMGPKWNEEVILACFEAALSLRCLGTLEEAGQNIRSVDRFETQTSSNTQKYATFETWTSSVRKKQENKFVKTRQLP
jgi:hypothetical protein